MYGKRQKIVPIYRPDNGTGNTVPFPFSSCLISMRLPFLAVFKPFPFCPKGSRTFQCTARTAKLNELGHNSAGS